MAYCTSASAPADASTASLALGAASFRRVRKLPALMAVPAPRDLGASTVAYTKALSFAWRHSFANAEKDRRSERRWESGLRAPAFSSDAPTSSHEKLTASWRSRRAGSRPSRPSGSYTYRSPQT